MENFNNTFATSAVAVSTSNNENSVWGNVLSMTMKLPGIKVDRDSFLKKELAPFCAQQDLDRAVENPVSVISSKVIDRLANACINNQTVTVTSASFFAGIPGGIAMAGTIPADIAQYYWHVLVLAQKLSYLYGMPDLVDENGELSENARDLLTIYIGVMMGVAAANNTLKTISKALAGKVLKDLSKKALTKTWYYPLVKQIAASIGIKITKESFAKGCSKIVPVAGGVISGGLTYISFRTSAKRLLNKLHEQMYDFKWAV